MELLEAVGAIVVIGMILAGVFFSSRSLPSSDSDQSDQKKKHDYFDHFY